MQPAASAPVAARRASSFCRAVPAASSRFATFAQAISSTKLTAPSRNVRPFVALAEERVVQEHDPRRRAVPAFSPRASSICRLTAVASACAEASDTPGFSRPTAIIQRASGILRRSFAAQKAMRSSHGTSAKPCGMTPMTVRGSPSTWIDRADDVRRCRRAGAATCRS